MPSLSALDTFECANPVGLRAFPLGGKPQHEMRRRDGLMVIDGERLTALSAGKCAEQPVSRVNDFDIRRNGDDFTLIVHSATPLRADFGPRSECELIWIKFNEFSDMEASEPPAYGFVTQRGRL